MIKKVILFLAILFFSSTWIVSAEVPYETWTETSGGMKIESQTAYIPDTTINDSFEEATDIFYYEDMLFVVEKGKARIDVYKDDIRVYTFGEGTLSEPNGIYVKDDLVYVADPGAQKVFVFGIDGSLKMEYGMPDEVYYGYDEFLPLNLVVDDVGSMYIVCQGVTEGLVQIDKEGNFLGFYGGNNIRLTLRSSIQKLLYTDEMEESVPGLNAPAITNVAIDTDGVIYTVTKNNSDEVRKLNIIGTEIASLEVSENESSGVNDIWVSSQGFVFTINDASEINVYTPNLELLFGFGGSESVNSTKTGTLESGSAITITPDMEIYALDTQGKKIEKYKPTAETLMLYEAIVLDSQGKYAESSAIWKELNESNVLNTMPYDSLAKNAFKNGDYKQAIEYYKLSFNNVGVSDSYWQIRNDFISTYLIYFIAFAAFLIIFIFIIKRFRKNKVKEHKEHRNKVVIWGRELKMFMFHPAEAIYQMRFHGQVRKPTIIITLITIVGALYIYLHFLSYIFNPFKNAELLTPPGIIYIIIAISILLVLLITSNYLITSVMEGEASFNNLVKMTIMSFTPVVVLLPILTIISYAITLNEAFVYNFIIVITIVWVICIYCISVQQLNNFTFKETAKNIFLTIFTMFIIIIIVFVAIILINEVIVFVVEIITEVLNA